MTIKYRDLAEQEAHRIVRAWRLASFWRTCLPQVFYGELIEEIASSLRAFRGRL